MLEITSFATLKEKDIEARSAKRKLLHVKADGQSADERDTLR